MKHLLLILMLFSSLLWGGVDFPKDVKSLKNLDALRATATSQREVLVFLKVNPDNTQEHVQEAVEDYVKRFKRFGPVIHVPLVGGFQNLPKTADQAFEKLSGSYPRLVVLDPENDAVVTAVPYLTQEDRDDEIKEYRRAVFSYLKEMQSRPRSGATPRPGW